MTRRGAAWGPTALVTLAALVAHSAGAGCAPAEERPDTRAVPEARPAAEPVRPAQRAASQVVPEAPRTLRLPGGTTVRVRAVGTRRDGRLAVPKDVRTAGWWRGGSRVGDPFGAVLVAGHVDSRTQGLGAYAELLTVRRGAEGRRRHRLPAADVPHPLPAPGAAVASGGPVVAALAPRAPATGPGHLRAAVRRGARWLPAPRRGDGVPRRAPDSAEPVMSGKKPPRPLAQPKRPVVPRPASGRPATPAVPDPPTDPPTHRTDGPRRRPPRPLAAPRGPVVPRLPGGRPASTGTVPSQRTAPRQLRVAPVPAPETRPGRTRLAARVAAVAALILGTAVALVVFVVRSLDEPVDPSTRGPARVPAAPADLAPRTTVVHARVTPSGDVVVRQWIRSASTAVRDPSVAASGHRCRGGLLTCSGARRAGLRERRPGPGPGAAGEGAGSTTRSTQAPTTCS